MIHFAVLGSGSSGNSAIACAGETRVLIDAGLSARQLKLRLESLGIDPESIGGILLTHEHGDHSCGIDVFCRNRPIPVFATAHTSQIVREGMRNSVPWQIFEAGEEFRIDDLLVESFPVPHDAIDPVGFVLRSQESALGFVSDIGHATALVKDRLQSVDTLFVESNYDETLLQMDTKRPWPTKQRISSRHGHLSNSQTADLVVSVAARNRRLHRVVLGHLSCDCNAPQVALQSIRKALEKEGLAGIEVVCADQKTPLPLRPAALPTDFRHCSPPMPPPPAAEDRSKDSEKSGKTTRPRHAETAPDFRVRDSAVPACLASGAENVDWRQIEWGF